MSVSIGDPRILVISPDEATRTLAGDQLVRRYGNDYEVVRTDSVAPEFAFDDLALLLVDVMDHDARQILRKIRGDNPSVRCIGIAPLGMPVASDRLQDLLREGLIDWFVIKPQLTPDEAFHRTISEFLEEWARDNGTTLEVVRMVDADSPMGHRLRDLLQRNNVPHRSYEPASVEGKQLLDQHGFGLADLPVLVLFDGRALPNPSEREIADALTGQALVPISETDVAIVGGGPSGLAAAVYAASEGLSVVVLEREAIGAKLAPLR